jgi:hypothetical protein
MSKVRTMDKLCTLRKLNRMPKEKSTLHDNSTSIIASDATHHIVNNINLLTNVKTSKQRISRLAAISCYCMQRLALLLFVWLLSTLCSATFNNVLFVPSMRCNLISVAQTSHPLQWSFNLLLQPSMSTTTNKR